MRTRTLPFRRTPARHSAFWCALIALSMSPLACELLIDTSDLDNGGPLTTGADGSQPVDQVSPPNDGAPQNDAPIIVSDAACAGEAGPAMVRVGSFCIDSTEVTNSDYEAFLATNPSPSLGPSSCAWKPDFNHGGSWTPVKGGSAPAGNVDWCDAVVYCTWAGKRLCGNPDGGSTAFASFADPSSDEWFYACSHNGVLAYPYGTTFDDQTCDGRLLDGGFPEAASTYTVDAVESKSACQGGFSGIFDMSGNVAEWEDCCDDSPGGDASTQKCRMRGGSANSAQPQLECADPASFGPYDRSSFTDDLGFRCCSP